MTFQLSGNAPDLYERVLVPLWMERWAKRLVAAASLAPGENVLDIACGTGVTTRLAKASVGPGGRVEGLDINAGMLAKARQLAEGLDISWIECDVAASGLPSDRCDVIICQHGYHYFPDKPAALREMRRLLAPNGRMAVSIWAGHSPYTRVLCDALEAHLSPDIARKQRAQRETPSAEELTAEVRAAGFSDVSIEVQDLLIDVPSAYEFVPQHLGAMPIADAFLNLDDGRKEALVEHVATGMRDYEQGGRLVYPDIVHVVMGEK